MDFANVFFLSSWKAKDNGLIIKLVQRYHCFCCTVAHNDRQSPKIITLGRCWCQELNEIGLLAYIRESASRLHVVYFFYRESIILAPDSHTKNSLHSFSADRG